MEITKGELLKLGNLLCAAINNLAAATEIELRTAFNEDSFVINVTSGGKIFDAKIEVVTSIEGGEVVKYAFLVYSRNHQEGIFRLLINGDTAEISIALIKEFELLK